MSRLRVVTALLLVAAAALFVVGTNLERSTEKPAAVPTPKASTLPTASAGASATIVTPKSTLPGVEGDASHETAERSSPASKATTTAAPIRTESPAQHAAEGGHTETGGEGAHAPETFLGFNTETGPIRTVVVVVSLAFAIALLAIRSRWLAALIGLACVALFAGDVNEAIAQVQRSNTKVLVIAAILAAMHFAASVVCGIVARSDGVKPPSV